MRFNFRTARNYDTAGGMRRRLVFNIVAFAVMFYAFFFLAGMCTAAFSNSHIPNEYREAANFDLTLNFIRGINPYALDVLEGDAPGCVFQYGPLFSLLVAGIHFILPFADIFVLHYIIALLCILAAAVMAAVIVRENTETLLPASCAFLFTIACTWRYGYVNAVPDTLGVTLLVLVFFVETRRRVYGKEYIEAALAVLLFYTKQYFVIVALSLFIYKLITDMKACIRLSVSGILLLVLSAAAVNYTCPLYFTYSLLIVHGVSGQSVAVSQPLVSNINLTGLSLAAASAKEDAGLPPTGWAFEALQLRSLISIFLFLFIGMLVGISRAFIQRTPNFAGSRLFVIHSMVAFAALLFLGQNDGAWLSYYLELLMPPVVIYSFISAEKNALDENSGRYLRLAFTVLLMFMVMYTTYRMDARLSYFRKSGEAKAVWDKGYAYCETYAKSGEILYRAPLGIKALEDGRYLYDNGHEMAIHQRFLDEYNRTVTYQKLFPYAGKLMQQHIDYRNGMREKVSVRGYSLVLKTATDEDAEEIVSRELLEGSGYVLLDSLDLDMGWDFCRVEFWVPADKDEPPLEATGTV
ncbi:MAG: hypothetical protein J5966_10130 [Lachnospiraceae bacterium]|nr:hypothetical protein [Lachnospiraceae bacterium]